MAIKIEMLRCFCVVAEKGSLQAAADHLGRTPSAVSMLLKQLEDHLGSKLFEKDRKNRLTDLGQYVFRQATNELEHFDATINAIETYARNPKGVLRIAACREARSLAQRSRNFCTDLVGLCRDYAGISGTG